MTRKNGTVVFPVKGRGAVKSRDIASAIREGRLTRDQFDAWHTQRRGGGLVITLRETTSEPAKPARRPARKHKK
ncbi:MAG: hypothetical protein PHS14_09245 [Elusimicrobia bacterium]|nr:hypothetical protein [Elusimicrobiota bacterium]